MQSMSVCRRIILGFVETRAYPRSAQEIPLLRVRCQVPPDVKPESASTHTHQSPTVQLQTLLPHVRTEDTPPATRAPPYRGQTVYVSCVLLWLRQSGVAEGTRGGETHGQSTTSPVPILHPRLRQPAYARCTHAQGALQWPTSTPVHLVRIKIHVGKQAKKALVAGAPTPTCRQ